MFKKIQATSNLVPIREEEGTPSEESKKAALLLEKLSGELKKERQEQIASSGIDITSLEQTEGEENG